MPNIPAEFMSGPKASPRSVQYFCDLLDERDLFADQRWFERVNAMDAGEYAQHLKNIKAEAATWDQAKVSKSIDWLKALPKKRQERAQRNGGSVDFSAIPDGRYALRYEDDPLNPIRFYKVKRGKDYSARGGRDWSNFLFVDRFSSDETFPVKGEERVRVLTAILFDVKEAALLFGHEENACCICGRRLTRRLSRELGIGPVCGGRNGWLTPGVIAEARERIAAAGHDPDEEVC